MFVIRQANGNLLVPEYAVSEDGQVVGDAYVEIGAEHPDYQRLNAVALTEPEDEERRRQWREGDESLRRQFLDYLARHGADGGWHGHGSGQ